MSDTLSCVAGLLPGLQWLGEGDTFGPGFWVHSGCPSLPGQVVSSILRNLSWRADLNSKKVLREVGSMTALMECVLRASKVSSRYTLRCFLDSPSHLVSPPRSPPNPR